MEAVENLSHSGSLRSAELMLMAPMLDHVGAKKWSEGQLIEREMAQLLLTASAICSSNPIMGKYFFLCKLLRKYNNEGKKGEN